MKKTLLFITGLSLIALLSLVGCSTSSEKRTAMGWAKMAVEEEHNQLDDDGYLLTHTVVIQTPSLELVEEAEGETYEDYLYVKDDDGDYYMAFFKHYLIVEKYGGSVEEYVYISAIAWRDNKRLDFFSSEPNRIKFNYSRIIDLDIEELE